MARNTVTTVKAGIKSGGDDIVKKVLTSRETLQASDLTGQTFNSVLDALKREGVQQVKIIPTRGGGHVVNVDNIERTGLVNLFPGSVMMPNGGKLNRVSFKFNDAGDILQMTGIQKHSSGAISGSTIRTSEGIAALKKAGVQNPTEYIQVNAGNHGRYVNKTYSPFGDLPRPVENVAKVTQDVKPAAVSEVKTATGEVKQVEKKVVEPVVEKTTAKTPKYSASEIQAAEKSLSRACYLIEQDLEYVNPELSKKVVSKLYKMAESDPVRARDFAWSLRERYGGNPEMFRSKNYSHLLGDTEDYFNQMNRQADEDYYGRISDMIDDIGKSKNPWDDPFGSLY